MKQYDIFEREFDGNIFLFQLTELIPHRATIRLLDDSLQIDRDISYHLGPDCPYKAASKENGVFVTTQKGDAMIDEISHEMYLRIKAHLNNN